MSLKRTLVLAVLLVPALPLTPAQAWWRVGIGIGVPYPYYYRPYGPGVVVGVGPVVVGAPVYYVVPGPAPVYYVQTAPGVYQTVAPQGIPPGATVYQGLPQAAPAPALQPVPQQAVTTASPGLPSAPIPVVTTPPGH